MTRIEFMKIAAYIGVATSRPLAPEALEVYFDLLGDLPAEAMQTASKRVLLEHRWASFPTVAEIRAAAAETMQGRAVEISPAEAWAKAWEAIGRIDPEIEGSESRACAGLPPIVVEAMRCLGIPSMCYGKDPVSVIRGQFLKVFEQLAARDKRLALLPPSVTKAIESKGKPIAAPVLQALAGIGKPIERESA